MMEMHGRIQQMFLQFPRINIILAMWLMDARAKGFSSWLNLFCANENCGNFSSKRIINQRLVERDSSSTQMVIVLTFARIL